MLTTHAVHASSPAGSPPAGSATRTRHEWVDRFLSSDPGLNRFRNACMSVLTIAAILEAEWLFVRFTHALQMPTQGAGLSTTQLAKVGTANHDAWSS